MSPISECGGDVDDDLLGLPVDDDLLGLPCVVMFCRRWSYRMLHHVMSVNQGGHILAEIKFPMFSLSFPLCYINFPCVIFTQKLTISPMNKGHITTVLLHTEVYKLIF